MSLIDSTVIDALEKIVTSKVQTDISLAEISSWKVGGKVRALITPSSIEEIIALRNFLANHQLPNLIIGNTTNLLFTDEDIDAVFIQISSNFSRMERYDDYIKAQAGVWIPKLARFALREKLTGIEHTCGIPGTLGGLIVMNGGSQRKGIGDNVLYVKTVDSSGNLKNYDKKDCYFDYRTSIFQKLDEVVIEVGLKLNAIFNEKIMHAEMLSILRSRSKKFPRKLPNCGSVFVSNPAMYEQYGAPGKIIEECGLKGLSKGGAQISPNHANFIVNKGNAKATDILYLIKLAQNMVFNKTGYLMKVEPKFINSKLEIKEI